MTDLPEDVWKISEESQRYDGFVKLCCTKVPMPSVIPGFSIYYILMLYDHMMYFGDKELLERHMPTVEGNFAASSIDNRNPKGYVEKIGGLKWKGTLLVFY